MIDKLLDHRIIKYVLSIIMFSSCVQSNDPNSSKIENQIIGDWVVINENVQNNTFSIPSEANVLPGMTFTKDSVENYKGFFKEYFDSISGNKVKIYLGNHTRIKIKSDSIFIKNLSNDNWDFTWKFIERNQDTLVLSINDSTTYKYKKLNYNIDNQSDFDQIVFSFVGCFGNCPRLNISINKNGTLLFQGEFKVNPIGIYKAKLNEETKKFIFKKFYKANPLELSDQYTSIISDDQAIVVTFVKDNKIVKTIYDFGMSGTNELLWAYIPISNIYKNIKLENYDSLQPVFRELLFIKFVNKNKEISLKKSESFYLLTKLMESNSIENETNQLLYDVVFNNELYLFSSKSSINKNFEIKKITSDGQIFKFELFNGSKYIYDLGYNFLDRLVGDGDPN